MLKERRLMGGGCYSSKKLGGCQRELGRLCWQLEGPQRHLRGRLRGKEYSLFETKIGHLKD